MSEVLSSTDGVRARKAYRCAFCSEAILKGSLYDRRTGIVDGDLFSMAMHPECHAFESHAGLTYEDYEDMSERSFTHDEALAFAASRQPIPCHLTPSASL